MCDSRITVVDVADARWVRVYDGPVATVQTHELEGRLEEIFRTRAQAVVYIAGNGDLPFMTMGNVIDIASRQADAVVILTPAVMRQKGACLTVNLPPDFQSARASRHKR